MLTAQAAEGKTVRSFAGNSQAKPTNQFRMKITSIFVALMISASFALAAEGEKPKGGKPKLPPEEVFKKKDTNADGKLSKDEFLAGAKDDAAKAKMDTQFTAKDKDKDGFLSLDEFKPAPKKKGGK